MSELDKANIIVAVVGKKGSGKSWWVKHELLPRWDRVLVVDPMGEYGPHVHAVLETPAELKAWLLEAGAHHHLAPFRVAIVADAPAAELAALRLAWALPSTLVVVEEVDRIASPGHSPPELAQLILRGRHRRISVVTVTQRPSATPIQLRTQADLVAAFQLTHPRDIEALEFAFPGRPAADFSNIRVGSAQFAASTDAHARYGIRAPLDTR